MPGLNTILPEEKLYGENIVRTNRIISYVLKRWTQSPQVAGENRSYLKAIYFDKFAELICRILDALHAEGLSRFPSAFEPRRGIHGPGRVVRIDREQEDRDSCGRDPGDFRQHKFAYIGEIIEKMPYLANTGRALFKFHYDDKTKPWSEECEFSSSIEVVEWEAWMKEKWLVKDDERSEFLKKEEVDIINRLADAITELSDMEIRALGTHHSPKLTVKAIEFNIDKWFSAVDAILKTTDSNVIIAQSKRLAILSDEIHRKSIKNRNSYESGRYKIKNAFKSGGLYEVFNKVQQNADLIWNNKVVQMYAKFASYFVSLSVYIVAIVELLYERKISSPKIAGANKIVPSLTTMFSKAGIKFPLLSKRSDITHQDFTDLLNKSKDSLRRSMLDFSISERLSITR